MRVLITRAAEDALGLAHVLVRMGHQPVLVPLLQRLWCIDELASLRTRPFDWIVVTSAAAADVLAAAAPGAWPDAKIGAVGPTTARRLVAIGRPPDVVPTEQLGVRLVTAMGDLQGRSVLYPRGDLTPPATADALRNAGALLTEVVAYRNVAPPGHAERLAAALPVDVTPLLSGSAAKRLRAAWSGPVDALGQIIAIGPSTAEVAAQVGLPVHDVATPHTLEGVLARIPRR